MQGVYEAGCYHRFWSYKRRSNDRTREGGNGKKPSEQKKRKLRKTEKKQHTEQKPKREHEPNKDYTERSIAFIIAFVPVDNEKPRKQAGEKEEEKLGRKGGDRGIT